MSAIRSSGSPAQDPLGATMTSGPHPAARAAPPVSDTGATMTSDPGPADMRVSDLGGTLVADSTPPAPPIELSGEATRREPVVPISAIERTAVGVSSRPRSQIDDITADVRDDPRTIQRFEVLRRLGVGGMGVVYAAYDWELERRLAIKVVRADSMTSDAGKHRMKREAQAMAKVSHPNVVQVYEVGEFDKQIYVAMEYIKGKSLSEWLQADERTWQEILEVYVQAGRGLAAAHRQGVVHRDFKPDNVLVDNDNRARVLDFGLARAEGSSAAESETALVGRGAPGQGIRDNLTLAGAIMGTPAFMSPEQHLGKPADARSDQFSFCVALYVGLYGQPPFAGESLAELGLSVTTGELRRPPEGTHVPAWVFAALTTGLATNPADRYPSMDTLLAAVSPDSVGDTRRRWLWPAALIGVSVLAVVLTLFVVGGDAPPGEDLETIARLQREAHEAAGRQHWVYPDRSDPRDTAYYRVVLLEQVEGPAAAQGLAAASDLRSEFSQDLVALGDRYFERPNGRPYARDFYVQALVFSPFDPRASDRARTTIGQLADLAERAASGTFSSDELLAAEPLRILADPDLVHAREDALALARDPDHGSAIDQARLASVFRSSGLLSDDDLRTTVAEPPAAEPIVVAQADPPPAPEPEPEPEPAVAPTKAGKRPIKPDKPELAAPPDPVVVAAVPEELPERVDPEASKLLAAEGDAARRRGDGAAAEKLYNKALDLWNGNGAALIGISDLWFERGDFARAVKYAEKAVRAEPTRGDYQIRLGDAYFKVFRYSDAQQRYKRAAELGHAKAAERLTRVQDKLGG